MTETDPYMEDSKINANAPELRLLQQVFRRFLKKIQSAPDVYNPIQEHLPRVKRIPRGLGYF